ncbi:hypothetical protein P170DRAFT_439158 [Aspergillus steynii IBT 23096]|uniref:Uncharacterized protein n=1 Tax=Aspergillus steynii IBT 23096 TaxID=1392250 RepID=A0A2I2FXM9_9EURO|nr:uncharacterized protein P170DRAFT_439158 [Aspergillus steynii IBT 23096]PLB45389.1 hypothetical protein P170DRAFT_439158 [Aspergillus steynii IBT 23096]
MPKLVPSAVSTRPIRNHFHPPRPANFRKHFSSPFRPLAQPRQDLFLHDPWQSPTSSPTLFAQTGFNQSVSDGLRKDLNGGDHQSPDERVLKLGKTLRILSPLLPTLLVNPLPSSILSPSVTLHLFPSTHPHLPTVKGRTLYRAALWTVPVAWSSLPLVGNVKLQILSERMVRSGTVLDPERCGHGDCGDERLVVRWRTEPRRDDHPQIPSSLGTKRGAQDEPSHVSASKNGINKGLSMLLGGDAPIFKLAKEEQFTGLFIFSFDEEGRVLSHTIEHADNASGWERTAKFVSLTDWLIGKARGSLDPAAEPGLAIQGCQSFEPCSSRGASRFSRRS